MHGLGSKVKDCLGLRKSLRKRKGKMKQVQKELGKEKENADRAVVECRKSFVGFVVGNQSHKMAAAAFDCTQAGLHNLVESIGEQA